MEFSDRGQGDLGEPLRPGVVVFKVDTSVLGDVSRHGWVRRQAVSVYIASDPQLTLLESRIGV